MHVGKIALGCTPDAMACESDRTADNYKLRFSDDDPVSTVDLPMGSSLPWTTSGQAVTIENLRSYQTIICDDYKNWAYLIVGRTSE